MDLKEIICEGVDWVQLARNRIVLQYFVSINELSVSIKRRGIS
jgi:hypothetical protein